MSMAPGEQRVLAVMERELRRSDPQLVTMLECFEPPGRYHLGWLHRRLPRRLALATLASVIVGLVAAGALLGRSASWPPCVRLPAVTWACPAAGAHPPGGCRAGGWSLTAPGRLPGQSAPWGTAGPAAPGAGGAQRACSR
jgi:Protein of unknown function (DUF3040)